MEWPCLILTVAALVQLGVAGSTTGDVGHRHQHHYHNHHSEHHPLQTQEKPKANHRQDPHVASDQNTPNIIIDDTISDVAHREVATGARRRQRDARDLITATTGTGTAPGAARIVSPPVGLIQPWSSQPPLLPHSSRVDHPCGSPSFSPHHHPHRRRRRHRRQRHFGDHLLLTSPSSSPSVPVASLRSVSRSHTLEEEPSLATSYQHHQGRRQESQQHQHNLYSDFASASSALSSPSFYSHSSSSLGPVTGGRPSSGSVGGGTLQEEQIVVASPRRHRSNSNKNRPQPEQTPGQQLISRRAQVSHSRRTPEEEASRSAPTSLGEEATQIPGGGGEAYYYPQRAEGGTDLGGLGQVGGGGGGGGGAAGGTVTTGHLEYYGLNNRSMSPTQGLTQEEVQAREDCERKMRNTPYPTDGNLYCNRTFDGWGCFNDTPAGTRASVPCPAFKKGFDPRLFGYKDCNPDGTWWEHPITNKSWTNYTTCVNTDDLNADTRTLYIFFAGYTISIVALLASLFIFFYFRQLQCDRVTIHRNLFASYILNGVSWVLYYSLAAMSGDTMMENPVWCQALHVVTQYLVACNFFWMFCEGLYLHTIIVSAFTSGKKLIIACYIIGWCSPIITTVIYTALRAHHPNRNGRCWLDETPLQYIVVGPIVLTIALNLAFLCNIVRVLITKLRAVNSPDTNQTRKAVRATLILIPLLGLQYILFPFRPDKGTPLHEVYSYVSAFVTSFQGLFVALIFCFCNGEVMSVLKRKWGQHRLMHGNANGRTAIYTQTTVTMAENTQLQAPKSPRLYDNRSQAPGGKPAKPASSTAFKLRLGRGRSLDPPAYEDVANDDYQMSPHHEVVKKCTSAV